MRYSPVPDDELYVSVAPLLKNMGIDIVDWNLVRGKEQIQLHVTVYKDGGVGVDDCSKAHRLIQARAEVVFGERDVYIEVASPGIDRNLKDASEFPLYIGRGIRCYRTDISDWTAGRVKSADGEKVTVQNAQGLAEISYAVIAKAKLDYSQEVEN